MKSMAHAFFLMSHREGNKLDSRTYSRLSEEHSIRTSESNIKRVTNKTHHFLDGESQRKRALKRVSDKTHHFLGGEIARESARKRVTDKTHNFLGGEIQRKSALKRVADGTNPLLGGEIQRKRVREGTHNLLGAVSCYDKEGNFIMVPKEIYHNQTGPIEDWDYVTVRSKEAKRRQQSESSSR
jgi:hypothetical protein